MTKKLSSYRFSDEVISLLEQLCKIHSRTATNMIEVLITEQAKRDKIKPKK